MKLMTVVGARPQFIKACPLLAKLPQLPRLRHTLVHTGQHFDDNMSRVFFDELNVPKPDIQLDLSRVPKQQGAQTAEMLRKIEESLIQEKPDCLIVFGDTNSTLAAALAAAKLHIPIAHIEAGLRSYNRIMPEEINRIITDQLSSWLFTPSTKASRQLRSEGFSSNSIHLVGDIMYDACRLFLESPIVTPDISHAEKSYAVATLHRAENTDTPAKLTRYLQALVIASQTFPIIFPIHPRTKQALEKLENNPLFSHHNILIREPLGYFEMAALVKNSGLVITDSGGLQKEAFYYKVPCLTLRQETEWTELLDNGWNHLVSGSTPDEIAQQIGTVFNTAGHDDEPYGDGDTAQRIIDTLKNELA